MSLHCALDPSLPLVPLADIGRLRFDFGAEATRTLLEVAAMPEDIVRIELRWDPALAGPLAQPSVLCKLLMDAGWMPHAQWRTEPHGEVLHLDAERCFEAVPADSGPSRFTVVVAASDDARLQRNADASPGLREVDARVIACTGAAGPAEALDGALPHCETDWVLVCSEDVYFPAGFGHRLNAVLAAIPPDERAGTLIGFSGCAVDGAGQGYLRAGLVVDAGCRHDHAASARAVTLDDLAVVVARDSVHRLDPLLGGTLWATGLALAAVCEHQRFAQVLRLPLHHDAEGRAPAADALLASAAHLLERYPAFGPIPTREGSIDAALVARLAAARRESAPAFRHLDEVGAAIERAIADGRHEDAMSGLVNGVHRDFCQPGVAHTALYYPGLDRAMLALAQRLAAGRPATQVLPPGDTTLILATELYNLGGHSKVVEDVSLEVSHPVIVLTDLFQTIHKDRSQMDWLLQRYGHAAVIALPGASLWSKAQTLHDLVRSLRPKNILYFNHHQDPLPFVATLASQPLERQALFHHCDHNPSLGCTVPGLRHVDFIATLHERCEIDLDRPVQRLPLYVPDQGLRSPVRVKGRQFSVVTSGRPGKFARRGPFALQAIVATALQAVRGQFFHIGPLDEAWLAEIRAHLSAQGLAASRFVHLGLVPSVWRQLAELDAAFYIGSAPVSGGRAGIEAQGCGMPVLPFSGFEAGSLLADYSSYANEALGWASLDQLSHHLRTLGPRHAELAAEARAFYERCFSRAEFRRALHQIIET
ncbi:hypothetical protein [uncultured Methylibium sp.]|uniref:hypothetical protein n=1 Tax=uncultured Methylibium sp. TaxID=381093 RepID=UPI0025ED636B|nr:hypothetical protein [uncultured Methylibium sp.]